MHRPLAFSASLLCTFLILLSCVMHWTHSPSLSLFTIADYAGYYGTYVSTARILSVAAFLVPALCSITFICSMNTKRFTIAAAICAIYTLVFCITTFVVLKKVGGTTLNASSSPGVYVAFIGSLGLLVTIFITRHFTKDKVKS